jgi:uncharacterized protein YecE (DUF72 family)
MGDIRIGTSGWHYKHWCGPFYEARTPPSRMFDCYQRQFETVELNNSFYRLPSEAAISAWFQSTPDNFLFATKASRYITHRKRLMDPQNAIDHFFSRMEGLGKKLGPILFQLPPRWNVNSQRLENFLQSLPRDRQYAFEFRDPSWNQMAIYDILRRHRAAYVITQIAGYQSPELLTTDFAYIRLHGPGEKAYQGDYTKDQLAAWAWKIHFWAERLNSIYVYFDNDQAGFATKNALELKALIRSAATQDKQQPVVRLAS